MRRVGRAGNLRYYRLFYINIKMFTANNLCKNPDMRTYSQSMWHTVLDSNICEKCFVQYSNEIEQHRGIDRWFLSFDKRSGPFSAEYRVDLQAHLTNKIYIEIESRDCRGKRMPSWVYQTESDILVYFIPHLCMYGMISISDIKNFHVHNKDFEISKWRMIEVGIKTYCTRGLLVPLDIFFADLVFEYDSIDRQIIESVLSNKREIK